MVLTLYTQSSLVKSTIAAIQPASRLSVIRHTANLEHELSRELVKIRQLLFDPQYSVFPGYSAGSIVQNLTTFV